MTETDAAQWIVEQTLAKLHDPAAYSIRDAIEEAAHVALEAMGAAAARGVEAEAVRGALLELHRRVPGEDGEPDACSECEEGDPLDDCAAVSVAWPCRTASLLLGAEAAVAR